MAPFSHFPQGWPGRRGTAAGDGATCWPVPLASGPQAWRPQGRVLPERICVLARWARPLASGARPARLTGCRACGRRWSLAFLLSNPSFCSCSAIIMVFIKLTIPYTVHSGQCGSAGDRNRNPPDRRKPAYVFAGSVTERLEGLRRSWGQSTKGIHAHSHAHMHIHALTHMHTHTRT